MLKLLKYLFFILLVLSWGIIFVFQAAIPSNQNIFKSAICFLPILLITTFVIFICKKFFKWKIEFFNVNCYLLFNSLAIVLVIAFQSRYLSPVKILPFENDKFSHLERKAVKSEFNYRLIRSFYSMADIAQLNFFLGGRDQVHYAMKMLSETELVTSMQDIYFGDKNKIKNTCLNYEGVENKYITCLTEFFTETRERYNVSTLGNALIVAVQGSSLFKIKEFVFKKLNKNDPYLKLKMANNVMQLIEPSVVYSVDVMDLYANSSSNTCMGEKMQKKSEICKVAYIGNLKFLLKLIDKIKKSQDDSKIIEIANVEIEAADKNYTAVSAKTYQKEISRFFKLKADFEKIVQDIDIESLNQEVLAYENTTKSKANFKEQQLITQVE